MYFILSLNKRAIDISTLKNIFKYFFPALFLINFYEICWPEVINVKNRAHALPLFLSKLDGSPFLTNRIHVGYYNVEFSESIF